MEVLAKKLYKIMRDKNLKKTKVNLVFLYQLAGLDFLSFTQLQKLQEQLDSLNIYFKQMSEKEFCLFSVGELSEVKPLRMSQQELDDLINFDINNHVYNEMSKKSSVSNLLPRDELILNIWLYLVDSAGEKKIVTFKQVAEKLKLGNHLSTKPYIKIIDNFCRMKKIPNLAWVVINASTGLPSKKISLATWYEEFSQITACDYSKYEDEFLNSYEVEINKL